MKPISVPHQGESAPVVFGSYRVTILHIQGSAQLTQKEMMCEIGRSCGRTDGRCAHSSRSVRGIEVACGVCLDAERFDATESGYFTFQNLGGLAVDAILHESLPERGIRYVTS